MNYLEMFNIISKPWLSANDIMEVANCGRCAATKIRNEIEEEVIKQGKRIPQSSPIVVPTTMVLNYLNLDEEYIYDMAKKQKEIYA